MAVWTSVARGATELVVSEGTEMLGVVQAARRYSLMSPAQVVVRWIGQPSSITLASCWWNPGHLGADQQGARPPAPAIHRRYAVGAFC